MLLYKPQIKALLEVMSSDTTRPVLTEAHVNIYDDKVYLTATDGYRLSSLKLSDDLKDLDGKSIPREELIKWWKLADRKSQFTDETVRELATKDTDNYPKWAQLLPNFDTPNAMTRLNINARYMVDVEQLEGHSGVEWNFYGDKFTPIVNRSNDNIHLIMPLKG